MRQDGRARDELRPVSIQRHYLKNQPGSVLIAFGDTRVLCTAVLEDRVPPFLRDTGSGWVTAEYAMLPASASGGRISRDASKKGRAQEISRLIGRSLRSVVNLKALGERSVLIDCDVIEADGGTRTASITGAYIALADVLTIRVAREELPASPLTGQCAAISVGIVDGEPHLDLCYVEDSAASADLNLVMMSDGTVAEIQGTAEGVTFTRAQLTEMLDMGAKAIEDLCVRQREALDSD